MKVTEDDFFFWSTLESDLKVKIPAHIKNSFHLSGFSNVLSFKSIDSDDINYVQEFVRTDLEKILRSQQEKDVKCLNESQYGMLFGRFAAAPESFVFTNNDIHLIKKLVCHVNKIIESKGRSAGLAHFQIPCGPSNELRLDFRQKYFFTDEDSRLVSDKSTQTENIDLLELMKAQFFLSKLIATANKNAPRKKNGYRYDPDTKEFASYLRMIAGPLAYKTLQTNLEEALPTLSAVNKYITNKKRSTIIEGSLRSNELLEYLTQRNLPLLVALSEDATRIDGRIQYDSKTNSIHGFVLPINKQTGMPVPFSYQARNLPEILSHFSSEKPNAQFVNVIIAQPVGNAPSFCLLIFSSDGKYTAEDVGNRWKHIIQELQRLNINVLTVASDSDPKYNSAMRRLSSLGLESNLFTDGDWFASGGTSKSIVDSPFYVQDTVHIATKMRNFLLKTKVTSKKLLFGTNKFISATHIEWLLNNISKDHHQLTATVLNPIDKQNFESVLRICDKKIVNLLNDHVKDSEATVAFLELLKDIIDAYMQADLKPLERVRKMWYATFVLRLWREHVITSKTLTLKKNFLTSNCYSCIELNAHSLILILLYLKENCLEYAFLPHLFSSQPCEAFFRKIRSFTSTYSTITNCSVKEILNRIDKIQLQSEISLNKNFFFPDLKSVNIENRFELPSKQEILDEIEECKQKALEFAMKIGLINEKKAKKYPLDCKMDFRFKKQMFAEKKCETDTNTHKVHIQKPYFDFAQINLKNYSEKFVDKKFDVTSPYIEVLRGGTKIIVRKSTLCWLLRKETRKLSSDRLVRVRCICNPSNKCTLSKAHKKVSIFPRKVTGLLYKSHKMKLRLKRK